METGQKIKNADKRSAFLSQFPVHGVTVFVRFGDFPQNSAWHAHGHRVFGNVPGNYAARADYGIISDGNAREHGRTRADPHVVPNGDGLRYFQPRFALFGVRGMFRRGKTAVGRDKHVVAESNARAVRDNEVMVGIELVAYGDIVAVIAPERRRDHDVPSHGAENFGKHGPQGFRVVGILLVVTVTFILAFSYFRFVYGVVTALKQAVERHFYFRFHAFSIANAPEKRKRLNEICARALKYP